MVLPNNRSACLAFLMIAVSIAVPAQAQFVDDFDKAPGTEWQFFTGDGDARLDFSGGDGTARMAIDATADRHNVWWAIIKRNVAADLDMAKLARPGYELRIEARVRPSHAPRRVNFMINTQRTTDFHQHLREYDLADTGWHRISMTTDGLDARPSDQLNVQLGATDWGPGEYTLEVDYYRAEVVHADKAAPDLGEPLVYHPPVPSLDSFSQSLPVSQDALINRAFPSVNFGDWSAHGPGGKARVLTLSRDQWAILRWDFSELDNRTASGAGVLALTTHSAHSGGRYSDAYGEDLGVEFGKVRVYELPGGPRDWQQSSVTWQSFFADQPLESIVNGQMVFDTRLTLKPGEPTMITLSRPVMQRLLDGTTRGLLLRPLGAIDAAVYDSQSQDVAHSPRVYFSTH